jgi:hypothetical protein
MNGHYGPRRWVVILLVVIMASAVGFLAYNAGVQHGVAISGAMAVERGAAPPANPYPYPYPYAYGWHPWGFGFGFFPFGFLFPLFFFAFWFFVIRALVWGGGWRRHYGRHGGGDRRDLPPMFDEWHRRAHERMNTADDENSVGRG